MNSKNYYRLCFRKLEKPVEFTSDKSASRRCRLRLFQVEGIFEEFGINEIYPPEDVSSEVIDWTDVMAAFCYFAISVKLGQTTLKGGAGTPANVLGSKTYGKSTKTPIWLRKILLLDDIPSDDHRSFFYAHRDGRNYKVSWTSPYILPEKIQIRVHGGNNENEVYVEDLKWMLNELGKIWFKPICNLPINSHSSFFTGRENYLEKLNETLILKNDSSDPNRVYLYGLRGELVKRS